MLEFSCADYTFPLLARKQALALVRLLNFDFVDIGLFERSTNFSPSELHASPQQFIHDVQEDLMVAGLLPADVFLQVGPDPTQSSVNDPRASVRQSVRDAFARTVELCFAVHCGHITGLPGVVHGDSSRDLALAEEETKWRVNVAAEAGIVYAIEPHLGSICGDTAKTHAFLSCVPGLTLTLDYGHFIFQGESNAAIHTLLPHASHMHIRGAAPGELQTSSDESTVDLPHIVQTLTGDYNGKLALEYVWSDWHDCNRTDNVSETVLMRNRIARIEAKLNVGEVMHV